MPDCEWLQLLSIHCQTTDDHWKRRQINKPTKQDSSKPNNSTRNNPHTNNKTEQEIDNFLAGPGKEADWVANIEITLKIHN